MMKPIWIVDDDQSIRWVLEKALSREKIRIEALAIQTMSSMPLRRNPPKS